VTETTTGRPEAESGRPTNIIPEENPVSDTEYYAVPDPIDPNQITYWRRDKLGRTAPWPASAKYGPLLYKRDIPKGLHDGRPQWVRDWYRANREPWQRAINDAIASDPDLCRARFAVFATRCCACGRTLTDPKSKSCGVGPECRSGLSEDTIGCLAVLVGRIHAEHLPELDRLF
jgi:uncharacterized protein DUF6011